MTITAVNNFDVITGDMGDVYLNTNTRENIYTHSGTDFELVGIMTERNLLGVVRELYGLPTSGNRGHAHLSHNLRAMIFKPTRSEPDLWIMGREGGYDYIGKHTNYVLIIAANPMSIFNKLKETNIMKDFGPPKVHLGCDY